MGKPLNNLKISHHESSYPGCLSPREIQVLKGIYEGLSNQEIADQLFLAVGTVKGYTHQIYTKIGVKNRVQAAKKAKKVIDNRNKG
ncbi:response regulator transcription factor [Bacillus sp. FJAT-50079]|uniref:response regulator transcription factor n=1 Tax=Bacillus sp. FJAT-50079 TaxID=2833577 RepID=UPI001BC8D314|nr:response regulator transcription factor [Bacillus sp. FJAT-50079]MBS4206722.1 response regulator transcription factor [Bacillus sp. FJAT-50079]